MDDKIKYEMEFPIQASPSLLYNYIATPSGLSEWYAEQCEFPGRDVSPLFGTEVKKKPNC